MSSPVTSWLAPVCVALGLLLFAGSARAQFEECLLPSQVPEEVFGTITDEAAFAFGELTDKVCKSIVKKGVSTCKAQVKTADKCFQRALDTNYAIAAKQCQQLEDSADRSECKAKVKSTRDEGKDEINSSKDLGLGLCDGNFALLLSADCLGELPT